MPEWVDKCVKRYIRKGFSEDEAWSRCMGAYSKRKRKAKNDRRKRERKDK